MELLDVTNLDEKYITVNGLNVRYIVRGSGFPLLLEKASEFNEEGIAFLGANGLDSLSA